jgi:hypothetical protein
VGGHECGGLCLPPFLDIMKGHDEN